MEEFAEVADDEVGNQPNRSAADLGQQQMQMQQKFLSDLAAQNAQMMETHKKQIEEQYQKQMETFMQQFAPPPRRGTGQQLLASVKAKRPILNAESADSTTSQFYAQSQDISTAPQIDIYEGGARTHQIRAVAEGGNKDSFVVRTSSSGTGEGSSFSPTETELAHTQPAFKRDKDRDPANNKTKKPVPIHPILVNNPLGDSVAPPSWQKVIDKKKSSRMRENREKREDMDRDREERQNKEEMDSLAGGSSFGTAEELGSLKGTKDSHMGTLDYEDEEDEEEEEEEEDEHFHRYDDTTQYMLKKTAFLVSSSKDALSKGKGKGKKSGSKKQSQSQSRKNKSSGESASRDSTRFPPLQSAGSGMGVMINAQQSQSQSQPMLVSPRISAGGGGITTASVSSNSGNSSGSPVRNILIKSVEIGGTSSSVEQAVVRAEQEQAAKEKEKDNLYHEDYAVEGEKVNAFEYEADADPLLALKNSEWENEIARHILSVYATKKSTVGGGIKESKSVLSFVDPNREETAATVGGYVQSEDGRTEEDRNQDLQQYLEDEGSNVSGDESGTLDTVQEDREKEKKKGKSSSRRNSKKINTNRDNRDDGGGMSAQAAERLANGGTVTAEEAGISFREEKSFRNHSKYRSCLSVRVGRTGKRPGQSFEEGEDISIRGSPRCFPIWFVSSGEIYSNWTKLPGGDNLQAQLANLYERRHFKEYLGIIEKIIDDLWRERTLGQISDLDSFLNKRKSVRPRVQMDDKMRLVGKDGKFLKRPSSKQQLQSSTNTNTPAAAVHSAAGDTSKVWGDEDPNGNVWDQIANDERVEEERKAALTNDDLISLWGQLILTANAFGVLCIEKKKFDLSLEILQKAERWNKRTDILPKDVRTELAPHILDAMAFYFYKNGKNMSAMTYTRQALEAHQKLGNLDNECIAQLHVGCILTQAGQFKEAHKCLYQVLAMVEDGRLAFESATPKQLCLVAISYHNLAVVQLKMLVPDLACKNSQNARKIARLCLSYSNRWMHVFQWTHDVAMEDIKFNLTLKTKTPLNDKQLHIIKELTADMYDPEQM